VKTKVVSIVGEIGGNGYTAAKLVDQISDLQPYDTLVVQVATTGGDLHEAEAIAGILTSLPNHVITKGIGAVYSAGAIIFTAGKERKAMPQSTYMMHPCLVASMGNASQKEQEIEWMKANDERIVAYFNGIGIDTTSDIFQDLFKNEKVFGAEQAKSLGLATEVIQPAKAKAQSATFYNKQLKEKGMNPVINWLKSMIGVKDSRVMNMTETVVLEDGTEYSVLKQGETISVGDQVVDSEMNPIPAGVYQTSDGSEMTCDENGVITVFEAMPVEPATDEAATALAESQAEIANLKAENARLQNLAKQANGVKNQQTPKPSAEAPKATDVKPAHPLDGLADVIKAYKATKKPFNSYSS
jgi:ATP-dependent protease ClpP protease subunit